MTNQTDSKIKDVKFTYTAQNNTERVNPIDVLKTNFKQAILQSKLTGKAVELKVQEDTIGFVKHQAGSYESINDAFGDDEIADVILHGYFQTLPYKGLDSTGFITTSFSTGKKVDVNIQLTDAFKTYLLITNILQRQSN